MLTIFHLFFFFPEFQRKNPKVNIFASIEKIQTTCNTCIYKQLSWSQDDRMWNTECWIFYQQKTINNNFWLRFTANVDVAERQTDVKTDGQCNTDRYTDGRTDGRTVNMTDGKIGQTIRQYDRRTDGQAEKPHANLWSVVHTMFTMEQLGHTGDTGATVWVMTSVRSSS